MRPLQRPATMRIRSLDECADRRPQCAPEVCFPPEVVALESERDIHRQSRVELTDPGREAPTDCLELATTCSQTELEAIASDELGRRDEVYIASDEHRRRITHAERLEMAQQLLEIFIRGIEPHFEIDPNFRNEVFGRE